MNQSNFPPGWDEEKVRKVLAHYEEQTEAEAVVEDQYGIGGPPARMEPKPGPR